MSALATFGLTLVASVLALSIVLILWVSGETFFLWWKTSRPQWRPQSSPQNHQVYVAGAPSKNALTIPNTPESKVSRIFPTEIWRHEILRDFVNDSVRVDTYYGIPITQARVDFAHAFADSHNRTNILSVLDLTARTFRDYEVKMMAMIGEEVRVSDAFKYFGGEMLTQQVPEEIKEFIKETSMGFDAAKDVVMVQYTLKNGKAFNCPLEKALSPGTMATLTMLGNQDDD